MYKCNICSFCWEYILIIIKSAYLQKSWKRYMPRMQTGGRGALMWSNMAWTLGSPYITTYFIWKNSKWQRASPPAEKKYYMTWWWMIQWLFFNQYLCQISNLMLHNSSFQALENFPYHRPLRYLSFFSYLQIDLRIAWHCSPTCITCRPTLTFITFHFCTIFEEPRSTICIFQT